MWFWWWGCADKTPPESSGTTPEPEPVWVVARSSYFGDRIVVTDRETGDRVGQVRGVDGAQTVVLGADGRWVACAEMENRVVIVDPATFEVVETLIGDDPDTPEDETGGLVHPDAAILGPDGRWYVSSFETDQVLRYEADGTFVDVFVDAGEGGMRGPDLGLVFDDEGRLYVPGWTSNTIHRYDADGAWIDDVLGPEDGLSKPRVVAFDDAGHMYVTGRGSGAVFRRDPEGGVTRWIEHPNVTGLVVDEARGELVITDDVEGRLTVFGLEDGAERTVLGGSVDSATSITLLPLPGP